MGGIAGRIAIGFIAAAISVLVAHESAVYAVTRAGLTAGTPWGMQPIPPWGVPRLLNNMFWGGLWGMPFALLYDRIPGATSWLKGLVYGLVVAVAGSWIVVPLIKGQVFGQPGQALLGGLDPRRMATSIIVVGSFGLALGTLYGWLRPTHR